MIKLVWRKGHGHLKRISYWFLTYKSMDPVTGDQYLLKLVRSFILLSSYFLSLNLNLVSLLLVLLIIFFPWWFSLVFVLLEQGWWGVVRVADWGGLITFDLGSSVAISLLVKRVSSSIFKPCLETSELLSFSITQKHALVCIHTNKQISTGTQPHVIHYRGTDKSIEAICHISFYGKS